MIKTIKNNWLLILILLAASILRLWGLSINPPHLTPDEAALGYNAFSILKTGKDEYGALLPIVFKSFGDFKPGLYIYASVPFVAAFGLNEFSTRVASALAGVIAVWVLWLITKQLFPDKKNTALVASALLAISPWHIHFSRGAWEVNLALTLTLLGIYFFLRAKENTKALVVSAFFFALTLLAYQGAKLSSSLVLFALVIVYRDEVKSWFRGPNRKFLLGSIVVGLVVVIPIVLSLVDGRAGRLKVFSIFSHKRPQAYLSELLNFGKVEFGSLPYYLYYSENLNTLTGILGRWGNHYSGRFLFFEGDWQNPRHSVPNQGVMQLADMVFIGIGIIALIKSKSKGAKFILLWLILAPLPAALSRDEIHAVRSFNMVIPLVVSTAAGLVFAYELLKTRRKVFALGFGVVVIAFYLASFIYFLDAYFVHQSIHNSKYWEYGYKQVVEAVTPIQGGYKKVHVRQSFAQPYIYFLFFQQYDPAKYQAQANLIEGEFGDVGRVEKFDNYCFCAIDWTVNRGDFGSLFVADPERIPPGDSVDPKEFVVHKEIKYLDNKETAFRIVEVKNEEDR